MGVVASATQFVPALDELLTGTLTAAHNQSRSVCGFAGRFPCQSSLLAYGATIWHWTWPFRNNQKHDR